MDVFVARRWWPVPAAVLLGVLIALLVSLTGSTSRRAEASVLISSPRGPAAVTPFLPNLRELATSSVLGGNVRSTLRLDESVEGVRDRLDADIRPGSQVIVVAATDDEAETARQIAQESAVVFTRLVDARFGDSTPPLQAAVLDSAHTLSAPNRHFLRNALTGAGAGVLLGVVAALLLGGGVAAGSDAAARDLREREKSLNRRIKEVTKRERELAKQAGRLGARERELAARSAVDAQPRPERVAAQGPTTPAALPLIGVGGWNVNELQRAVDAQVDSTPEGLEQWRTYLFFLREHAAADGSLPPQFDNLVADVFGDLL
jgi:hypothetical protein